MDMNVLFVVTWSYRGRKKNWYRRLNWWFTRLGVDIYEFISNSPLCLKVHLKLSIDYRGEFSIPPLYKPTGLWPCLDWEALWWLECASDWKYVVSGDLRNYYYFFVVLDQCYGLSMIKVHNVRRLCLPTLSRNWILLGHWRPSNANLRLHK